MKLHSSPTSGICQLMVSGIALVLSGAAAFATGTTYTLQTGSNGTTWDTTASWSMTGGNSTSLFPNEAGDIANSATASSSVTMTLNGTATIGKITKTTGSSSNWTINAGTSALFIFDNTGGTGLSEISTSSGSSQVIVNTNIEVANTDMQIGPRGGAAVTIGGAINAAASQTRSLTLFNNGTGALNINGSVGASGGNINIEHTGSSSGTATVSGSIGANVLGIKQNSSTSGLAISGNTSAFLGDVTVTLGTLNFTNANGGSGFTAAGGTFSGSGTVSGAVAVTGGNLAAGTDGTVGTLTFNSTLNIVGLSGTGQLKFDLAATGASDKVLLNTGALSIGAGVLNFNDFSFSALSGFDAGIYTLIDTSTSISGTLGTQLTGTINGYDAVLSSNGQDILLTVTNAMIPEPSTYAIMLGMAALTGSAALRRRRQG